MTVIPRGRTVATVELHPGRFGEVTGHDVAAAHWPVAADHVRVVLAHGLEWRADAAAALARRLAGRCRTWSVEGTDPDLADAVTFHLAAYARGAAT